MIFYSFQQCLNMRMIQYKYKLKTTMDPQQQMPKICQFYILRKRRTCKFTASANSNFCPAHGSDQNKIECPYQKGMFIQSSKFERHLEICPMIKNKNKQQQNQWFNKGVNLTQKRETNEVEKISNSHLIGIEQEKILETIKKIVGLFMKEFNGDFQGYICSSDEQKIGTQTNDHIQAHLLANTAQKYNLIRPDIIYLQFGAGKGILSYHLALKVKENCHKMSKHVLLERQSRRNKFDRFMKDNVYFQRYKSDVSDFDVKRLPETMVKAAMEKKPDLDRKKEEAELNDLQIVGVCKHMCGQALDISIRALLKTKMSGCILASCCHHLCSYDTYLNNKFFEQRGLSPQQIAILFKLSSWGTKSSLVQKAQINPQQLVQAQLQGVRKVIIGRICKRLIDLGRAQYLNGELLRYCSDQITPQNFVIISHP